jgi:predicted FMN-binding regulatory protein PaiB
VYTPKHFALDDRAAQFDLIDRYPFGTLTTVSHGRLSISTIPFVLERERSALDGHIARADPHWREFADISDAFGIDHPALPYRVDPIAENVRASLAADLD